MVRIIAFLVGLGFAVWRLIYGPTDEIGTILVSSLWVLYNLLIVGSAVAIAAEVRQVREAHRVLARLPAALRLPNGRFHTGTLVDYSDGGVGLELDAERAIPLGERVSLMMQRGNREFLFPGVVTRSHRNLVGIAFNALSPAQKIDYVQCTFARADAWLNLAG